jgi:hypothetical protein
MLFLPYFNLFLPFILLNSRLLYSFFQILSVPRLKACDDATQQSALCVAVIHAFILFYTAETLSVAGPISVLWWKDMKVIIEMCSTNELITLP